MSWTTAWSLESHPRGTARVFRADRTQVAVFHLDDGSFYAVDNRCPHEGYPLQQGLVKGTTLTCAWHNFKFDLGSGACLMGEEAVRTFPVRVVDGAVELDVRPVERSADLPRLFSSLEEALRERRQGQLARDVVRLLDAGVAPSAIAARGAAFDCDHGDLGPSHALAVLADVLAWTSERPGLEAALPLAQALDMASEPNVRRLPRTRPAPVATTPGFAHELKRSVEDEEAARAEGLVRGALASGLPRAELERALYACVAEHFLDFGHALIYQNKAFELLEKCQWEHADAILGGHVFGIVNGTREDALPAWAGFRRRLAAVDLAALEGRPRAGVMAIDALTEGRPGEVLERVLASDAPLDQILAALTEAAARHFLSFDVAIDLRVDVQDDWLDVTHRLTFVDAVRTAMGRWDAPERWRLVLQAAWFVANAAPLDGPPPTIPHADADTHTDSEGLTAALVRRDAPFVLGVAARWLAGGRVGDLRRVFMDVCLADLVVRPIVVVHLMKTTLAAFTAHAVTGSPTAVLALGRWLASPVRERRVGRRVHEAIRLVRDGKPPERLSE